jgi:hypothetical protein
VPPASRQRLGRIRLLIPAAIAGTVFLLLRAASPDAVERVYSRTLYPVVARIMGFWSDLVPFSVAEILVLALAAVLIFLTVRGTVRLVGRRTRPLAAAGSVARLVLVWAPVAYLLFALLWGANYARRPIEEKIGFAKARVTPESYRRSLLMLATWAGEITCWP